MDTSRLLYRRLRPLGLNDLKNEKDIFLDDRYDILKMREFFT